MKSAILALSVVAFGCAVGAMALLLAKNGAENRAAAVAANRDEVSRQLAEARKDLEEARREAGPLRAELEAQRKALAKAREDLEASKSSAIESNAAIREGEAKAESLAAELEEARRKAAAVSAARRAAEARASSAEAKARSEAERALAAESKSADEASSPAEPGPKKSSGKAVAAIAAISEALNLETHIDLTDPKVVDPSHLEWLTGEGGWGARDVADLAAWLRASWRLIDAANAVDPKNRAKSEVYADYLKRRDAILQVRKDFLDGKPDAALKDFRFWVPESN